MTPEQFAYWLRGFAELNPIAQPTPEQWLSIQQHLETVFKKQAASVLDLRGVTAEETSDMLEHIRKSMGEPNTTAFRS